MIRVIEFGILVVCFVVGAACVWRAVVNRKWKGTPYE